MPTPEQASQHAAWIFGAVESLTALGWDMSVRRFRLIINLFIGFLAIMAITIGFVGTKFLHSLGGMSEIDGGGELILTIAFSTYLGVGALVAERFTTRRYSVSRAANRRLLRTLDISMRDYLVARKLPKLLRQLVVSEGVAIGTIAAVGVQGSTPGLLVTAIAVPLLFAAAWFAQTLDLAIQLPSRTRLSKLLLQALIWASVIGVPLGYVSQYFGRLLFRAIVHASSTSSLGNAPRQLLFAGPLIRHIFPWLIVSGVLVLCFRIGSALSKVNQKSFLEFTHNASRMLRPARPLRVSGMWPIAVLSSTRTPEYGALVRGVTWQTIFALCLSGFVEAAPAGLVTTGHGKPLIIWACFIGSITAVEFIERAGAPWDLVEQGRWLWESGVSIWRVGFSFSLASLWTSSTFTLIPTMILAASLNCSLTLPLIIYISTTLAAAIGRLLAAGAARNADGKSSASLAAALLSVALAVPIPVMTMLSGTYVTYLVVLVLCVLMGGAVLCFRMRILRRR